MNRRRLLAVIAIGGTLGVAGCLGGDRGSNDDNGGSEDNDTPPNGTGNGTGNDDPADGDGNGTDDSPSGDDNGDPSSDGPEASFAADPTESEVGESVTFDGGDSTGDIAAYHWDFTGDGETDATGETATYTFEESGAVTVTLEVEGQNGNKDEVSQTIQVSETNSGTIQRVAFDWSPENPELGDEITFSAEQTVGDIVEYRWNFTGGTGFDEVTTDPVTSFTLSEEDTLEVTLEVEDESGAVASTTETVIEQQGVSPAFDWSPENPEPGQEVTFDASISQGGISEYRWDFDGDGTVDETTTEPTATYTFEEPDIYDVEMIAVGAVNTGSTDARINVSEPIQTTSFEFTPENPEPGQQITFDASISEGEISEYRWDFTDSGEFDTVTSDPVVTHTFETEAVQSVTLEVQRADGTSSVTGSVVVGNPPSVVDAVFDYEPETPTVGQQVTFDAGDSTGDIATYRWDFTDNQTPDRNTTDPVVTYTFDSPGEYPVTLAVVHDEENFDVTSKTLTVVE